jgi:hypothetical protein
VGMRCHGRRGQEVFLRNGWPHAVDSGYGDIHGYYWRIEDLKSGIRH